MKKSELNTLTQIIECLVAREVRKQLPSIIAETFQNMMGKSIITEQRQPEAVVAPESIREEIENEPSDFKASLRELFAGTPVMKKKLTKQEAQQPRQFTKNPMINQILNETVSDLVARERLVGAAAFQGGYSPAVAMAAGSMMNTPAMTGAGVMMEESEPASLARMPVMPGGIPVSRPPVLAEGQVSNHVPLEALPTGMSALDVARQIPDPTVKQALTRNYSQMMKLIDKKRGKA